MMLFELHAHSTRYSRCSIVNPVEIVQQAIKKGLQGIVLTEHHYQWLPDELARLAAEAGAPSYFRILAGQEVETDIGHVLVFGAPSTIKDRTSLATLRAAYPDAALIWAHPFRKSRIPTDAQLTDKALDGIEILSLNQSPRENYRGLCQWHRFRFTAVSGSDVHSRPMAGVFPTEFDHPLETIADIAGEIRNGRCRPFLKEIPKAGTGSMVTEVTIGTKGDDEQRHRIIIRSIQDQGKWENAKASAQLISSIYDAGFKDGEFRVPRIIEVNDDERLIIEEGQRGNDLYDVLVNIQPPAGERYFEMAAEWLARLHALELRKSSPQDTYEREKYRFISYSEAFVETGNPHQSRVQRLLAFIQRKEEELFGGTVDSFVQCHGDYHPKNIIIGRDRMHDPATAYISVIDFNNSILFSPAYDAGYFLAQFRSQFYDHPSVLGHYNDDLFIAAYLRCAHPSVERYQFIELTDFFKLRAYMSIASHFVKVGKGEGSEMDFVITEATALMDKIDS